MDDRELLNLAAKGAGLGDVGDWWNPLRDDGDAFRLAVLLSMQVGISLNGVSWAESADAYLEQDHGSDAEAATRRVIVRIAAQIALDKQ